jgi:hypothetical protein
MPIPRAIAAAGLLVPLLAGCASPAEPAEAVAMRRIISAQAMRHPQMEPQDLYKLLHQAAMGSAHAIEDTAGVRLWMERELVTMGDRPIDPLVDTIAPDGAVVLVHLRPWVAAGRSTDSLLQAFVRSAGTIPPDTAKLARYLDLAEGMVREGGLPFGAAAWRDLVEGQRRGGFPAVHHSPSYEMAYHPAYRVVQGALLP